MSKESEAVTKHRRKRRHELVYIMGGKCAICGYNKCEAALELHHLNPDEKDYGLSSGNCKSIEEDISEAKKCILVCANCHREIHNNMINNEQLLSSFDNMKAEEILQEYQKIKQKTFNHCKECGKIISRGATYCVDCFSQIRENERKNTRPDRDELKKEIRSIPFTTIGKEYGVSDNAIRKWCDAYNLPRKKTEINSYSDEEWEKI